jgi:hypothetical protein
MTLALLWKNSQKAKSPTGEGWAKCLIYLGWLMGLEPTTTGITILTLYYLHPLIDVVTIHINQQLTVFFWQKQRFKC